MFFVLTPKIIIDKGAQCATLYLSTEQMLAAPRVQWLELRK
jgi:hypothetical protein